MDDIALQSNRMSALAKYILLSGLWALGTCLLVPANAQAHRVTIFAWVDGNSVHTLSKFSGGRRAQNAQVQVYDVHGKQLLAGHTDEKGEFSFERPQHAKLRIVLNAGMGHHAEWILRAEKAAPNAENTAAVPPPTVDSTSSYFRGAKTAVVNPQINVTALQTTIEKALDQKLRPIAGMLADLQNKGPDFRDVLGGIGYIIGLVGLAAYINYRRKTKV